MGFIHGDLKGVNILVSLSGRAYLAGFDLTHMTSMLMFDNDDNISGTIRWMAPEMFAETPSSTLATDVYAFAMVCYEMFSLSHPFKEIWREPVVMLSALEGKRPSRPSDDLCRTRGLSDDIWHLIEDCWNQDPVKRPTISQVVKYLRDLPNRPVDQRPIDEFNPALFSLFEKSRTQTDNPFSSLEDIDLLPDFAGMRMEVTSPEM